MLEFIISVLKKIGLANFLRKLGINRALLRKIKSGFKSKDNYEKRLANEIEFYKDVEDVHALPEIYHYWSNKYLVPKMNELGIDGVLEFYVKYIVDACEGRSDIVEVVSMGAGNCDTEIAIAKDVIKKNARNFRIICVDINKAMLDRGAAAAESDGLSSHIIGCVSDIKKWKPSKKVDIFIANQSLHHFLDLEILFEKIKSSLSDSGVFLTSDMIGRNGHMRWPEAYDDLDTVWKTLPDKYKYNHILTRFEETYENWDCSVEGFEGIRAQDILPLLIKNFNFEVFFAFNCNINIFIDRCFGHNFDPDNEEDRKYIDLLAEHDEKLILDGVLKPTQLLAAMRVSPVDNMLVYKHLTPEFCLRNPD